MRNTLDTIDVPGRVFTNSSAGRIVWAVVCAAPDTIPSARPSYTIIVPKKLTSVMMSRARSRVMPLCRRSS
ncbi:MAG: hypothetical protein R2697_14110 [Ilumatobacteraceae bacterium]